MPTRLSMRVCVSDDLYTRTLGEGRVAVAGEPAEEVCVVCTVCALYVRPHACEVELVAQERNELVQVLVEKRKEFSGRKKIPRIVKVHMQKTGCSGFKLGP
jgi:hypothetical protein